MAQRHGAHKDIPVSVRLPADLREWLRDKAGRDGGAVHGLMVRAVAEMRERDNAAASADEGSGTPDAIART